MFYGVCSVWSFRSYRFASVWSEPKLQVIVFYVYGQLVLNWKTQTQLSLCTLKVIPKMNNMLVYENCESTITPPGCRTELCATLLSTPMPYEHWFRTLYLPPFSLPPFSLPIYRSLPISCYICLCLSFYFVFLFSFSFSKDQWVHYIQMYSLWTEKCSRRLGQSDKLAMVD